MGILNNFESRSKRKKEGDNPLLFLILKLMVRGASKEIAEMCMMIWRRGMNPSSMKLWDYISIYYPGDFKIKFT